MSHHQPSYALRLAVSSAAEALISDLGPEAYAVARRRAEEASSDILSRDWSQVALEITRKTAKRSSLFGWVFL
jgi:hypothetical protein